jgi:hypothetical protein
MAVSYKFSFPRVEKIEQISDKEEVISALTYAVQAQSTEFIEHSVLITKKLELDYSNLDSFVDFSSLSFEDLLAWILEYQSVTSIEEIDIVAEAIQKIKQLEFESSNKTVKTEVNTAFGSYRSIV